MKTREQDPNLRSDCDQSPVGVRTSKVAFRSWDERVPRTGLSVKEIGMDLRNTADYLSILKARMDGTVNAKESGLLCFSG